MAKKLKVDESTQSPKALELLKDLEELQANVMNALAQKDKIIEKQDQLLTLRKDLLDSYELYVEKLEKEHNYYVKITSLIFLTIAIVSIIGLIYNIIHI